MSLSTAEAHVLGVKFIGLYETVGFMAFSMSSRITWSTVGY